MKKHLKILALIMTVVVVLGCLTGCAEKKEEGVAYLTVGIPYTEEHPQWDTFKAMIEEFEDFNAAKVTLVKVPSYKDEPKEYEKFLKDVRQNKIHVFYSEQNELLDTFIDEGKFVDWKTIIKKDERYAEKLPVYTNMITRETNKSNLMFPMLGSYQALICNTALFTQAGVAVPTDWATFIDAIAKLKAAGITPMAAGFADGSNYLIDELILSEGGIAEHSTVPRLGVIASWERALSDIKSLYDMGAFQNGAADATHADALALFAGNGAAMMVADSASLEGIANADSLQAIEFPTPATGIKEKGTIIASSNAGWYITKYAANFNVDESTTMSGVILELYNSYFNNPMYYSIIKEDGKIPMSTETLAEYKNTALDASVGKLITESLLADVPMVNNMLTFTDFAGKINTVLKGEKSVKDYLAEATTAEVQAQEAAKQAKLEAEK